MMNLYKVPEKLIVFKNTDDYETVKKIYPNINELSYKHVINIFSEIGVLISTGDVIKPEQSINIDNDFDINVKYYYPDDYIIIYFEDIISNKKIDDISTDVLNEIISNYLKNKE